MNINQLTNDIKQRISDAARPLTEKHEAQDVALQGGSYRLVYAAFSGCAGGTHNMQNLAAAQSRLGVAVEYLNVNVGHYPINPRVFGSERSRNDRDAMNQLSSLGLSPIDPRAALVRTGMFGREEVVGYYNTRDRDFVQQVARATGQQQAPTRGRSH